MDIVNNLINNYEVFFEAVTPSEVIRVSSGVFKSLVKEKDRKFIVIQKEWALCSKERINKDQTDNPASLFAGHMDRNYIYPFEYIGEKPMNLLWNKASEYLSFVEKSKPPCGMDVGMLVALKYKPSGRFVDKYNYTVDLDEDSAILRKLENNNCYVFLLAGTKILSVVYNINTGVQYNFDLYP